MSTFHDSFDDSVAPQAESTHPFDDEDGGYEQFPPVYGEFENGNGPILPPPSAMAEEGFALREWRRENAVRLEEKERVEKEMLSKIIKEAEEYKVEFYKKREVNCEYNKGINREREKVIVAGQKKFHAEADKDYWKAIAELVPKEVPTIEKKRGKKDQEKKPGITVIQGPKHGRPTDLARMRHLLLKLKHTTPVHLKHSPPPPPPPDANDTMTKDAAAPSPPADVPVVASMPEPVAVT